MPLIDLSQLPSEKEKQFGLEGLPDQIESDENLFKTKEKKLMPKKPSLMRRFGRQFLKGLPELAQPVIGAGKEFLRQTETLSKIGQRGLQALTPSFGKKPIPGRLPEKLTTPTGTGQEIGALALQIGEFLVPGAAGLKAPKAAGLLTRAGVGAAEAAGITAFQEERVGKEAATAAVIGGGLPLLGAPLKKFLGMKRLINKATGLTPTVTRNADEIAKIPIKVGTKKQKAYDNIGDFFVKEGFFQKGLQTTRDDMVDHARLVLDRARATKKHILSAIESRIDVKRIPRFKALTKELIKRNKGILGQEETFTRLNQIAKKKRVTANDIDDVRRFADDFMFNTSDTEAAAGIRNTLKPIRNTLADLDRTGTIQKDNLKIRVLSELLGVGTKTNPFATAAQRDPTFSVMSRLVGGAGAGVTAGLIPGLQALAPIAGIVGATEAAVSHPQIASALIKKFTQAQALPSAVRKGTELLPRIAKGALIKGGAEVVKD